MFMVKCKYFADANITNILNIRKFFAIFFKKKFTISPSFINFCYQGKATSLPVNKPTGQQVEVRRVRQVRQEMGPMGPIGPMGPKTKQPPKHPPKKLVDPLTR